MSDAELTEPQRGALEFGLKRQLLAVELTSFTQDLRALIMPMAQESPIWGEGRIADELSLKGRRAALRHTKASVRWRSSQGRVMKEQYYLAAGANGTRTGQARATFNTGKALKYS
jgi:hypothetical protein